METCDTSARGSGSKGWFWEPDEELKEVRSELVPLYHKTIGKGANLLLNVIINREGRVSEATAERLREFNEAIKVLNK